ncbi:MAG: hypothetical protein AAF901_14215, partial [Bacteroidota bacterium]
MKDFIMISKDYLFTKIHTDIRQIDLQDQFTYFYSHDIESRSKAVDDLININKGRAIHFIRIAYVEDEKLHDFQSNRNFSL